jgi:hypothetical protein
MGRRGRRVDRVDWVGRVEWEIGDRRREEGEVFRSRGKRSAVPRSGMRGQEGGWVNREELVRWGGRREKGDKREY